MTSAFSPDESHLAPWQEHEREDFLKAVARHRRATWRITLVCLFAYALLALLMAILLAPFLYCLAGLFLDILNRLTPMPDLLTYAGKLLTPIIDKPETLPLGYIFQFILLASSPGLLLMMLVFGIVSRAIRKSAIYVFDQRIGRKPSAQVLAEQQFANTVEEMAVAAMIEVPNVVIVEGGANAATMGIDSSSATILIGESLLNKLERPEMQGVAAHLIASIANDDIRIGLRTASLLGLFSLIARLTVNVFDNETFKNNFKLIKALLTPHTTSFALIIEQLSEPFSDGGKKHSQCKNSTLTWRECLMMPLLGPVWVSGFLGGLVSTMMLSPGIALAWRQRKYMADATAVRLTREPNGLYNALRELEHVDTRLYTWSWASHLCVVNPGASKGMIFPIFPSLQRRLTALVRMGAHQGLSEPASGFSAAPLPLRLLTGGLLFAALGLLIMLIPMLAVLSTMLTGIFTLFPVAILHFLLR